jgi:hypothetical protein
MRRGGPRRTYRMLTQVSRTDNTVDPLLIGKRTNIPSGLSTAL